MLLCYKLQAAWTKHERIDLIHPSQRVEMGSLLLNFLKKTERYLKFEMIRIGCPKQTIRFQIFQATIDPDYLFPSMDQNHHLQDLEDHRITEKWIQRKKPVYPFSIVQEILLYSKTGETCHQ